MNVKALAAIVGTLSLGALATGCASSKAAETPSGTASTEAEAKGAERACQIAPESKEGDATKPSEAKGNEAGCGAAGCGSKK